MLHTLQGKNLELTSVLERFIADKIQSLERITSRFDQDTIEARVEISKPSRHHRSGFVFYAEINLKLPGQLLRAEVSHLDLNFAINEAFEEIEKQVKKYKDKLTQKRG